MIVILRKPKINVRAKMRKSDKSKTKSKEKSDTEEQPKPIPTNDPETKLFMAEQRIKDLEEKLAVMNEGQHIKKDDYAKLEARLYNMQDDHLQLGHAFRELDSRYTEMKRKNADLESKIAELKAQKTERVTVGDEKDTKIRELQLEVDRYESLHVKNRQDYIQYIADKKKLIDTNKRYEAHIADVDNALTEMMNRNKEMAKTLQETQNRNEQLEAELANQKRLTTQLEHEIARSKSYGFRRGRERDSEMRLDVAENNFADAKQKLILANNTINDLKQRIQLLEKEEKRAAKLQIALDQRNQQIVELQDNLDQCEMELQSYRGSAEEFRIQIEEARDRLQLTTENAENHINAMKAEVEYYRKRTEKEFKKNAELEENIEQANKELHATKMELEEFLSGRYGLTEAVNEMRQLKTMVSVRDAQIADMIMENGWYQRVIAELEGILPKSFDFQGFYDRIDEQETERELKITETRAVELVQKTLAAHKNAPIGQVKIILGADKHKKTIVRGNNADGELEFAEAESFMTRAGTSQKILEQIDEDGDFSSSTEYSDDGIDDNSFNEASFSLLESSQMIGRKRKERKMKKLEEQRERELNSTQESLCPSPLKIPELPRIPIVTRDIECQTDNTVPEVTMEPVVQDNSNDDDWLRNFKREYEIVKRDRAEYQKQVITYKELLDSCQKDLSATRAKVEELRSEVDRVKLKAKESSVKKSTVRMLDFSSSSDETPDSPRSDKIPPPKKIANDPLRMDSDVVVPPPAAMLSPHQRPKLSVSIKSAVFEVTRVPPLDYFHNEEDAVLSPSPAEKEVFDARNNAYKEECEKLHKLISEKEHDLENVHHKLSQCDQAVAEKQKTIENLEHKLNDQREAFQEKIIEMNNSAEKILEARLKEARDMDALMNSGLRHISRNDDELAEVSLRIQKLNHDKQMLEDELREVKEAMSYMQRQNDTYQRQVRALELEKLDMQEKAIGSSRQQELKDYASGLKVKYTALQKKYTDLQKSYDEIKRSKAGRNDPLMMSAASERSVDEPGSARSEASAAKVKSLTVKNDQLRTQNEEMQLRLSKANSQIERLNLLVQRKEAQITNLQAQVSQYKHQAGAGTRPPSSARSRRPM